MSNLFSHPARVGWLLLVCCSASAQAAGLTLEQSLSAAERYSAELSANRHQVSALRNMADSALQLPDPKLKLGIENIPVQGGNGHRLTRDGMTMGRIGIMQDYVSGNKRQRKADTLRAEAEKTSANSAAIRARLQQQTAQAWLELALSQQTLRDARALVAESERQISAQRAGVASGSSSASEVVDARLTLLAMQDQISTAERDVTVAQARLTQLTGQQIEQVVGKLPRFERLPADGDVLRQAIRQHPDVVQAGREADVAKARSAQSAIAAIPDVGVEVYYARRADGYEDMAGVMLSVDLPLFKAQRQDKNYAADVSRTLEANDQLTLLIRDHRAQLDTLLAQYQAAQAQWQRQQQQAIPLQQQRLDLLLAQYRSGNSNLSAVLSARRALLDARLNAGQAARQLAQLWAAIRYLIPQEIL
ncbi:TolC family protein [Serratia rhizosphaerae]|uniref:TolC family protein n=1 Tax=unclassified Serratia (in: enterobacteria) TaxID=2647522 RepID=UPI000CF67E30|nr:MULTISPECIES: TolC family protein [unclassified Serratia (in: enterobacteria)]AVJ18642.1 heavy metal RND transporter [Serratia sp. MYb239]MBU3892002.1 TolC family protein [Serratia rubidaea]QPT12198.1 TolC family protein [Serratia rubidaea]CAE1148353.1 Heavy metal RND efflux outer membrane protein, CzcC family [Serratia sp. Tan611]